VITPEIFPGTTAARRLVQVVDFQVPFDPCRFTDLALGQCSAKALKINKHAEGSRFDLQSFLNQCPIPLGLCNAERQTPKSNIAQINEN